MEKFKDGKASYKDWFYDLTSTLGALDPEVSRAIVRMMNDENSIKLSKKKRADRRLRIHRIGAIQG